MLDAELALLQEDLDLLLTRITVQQRALLAYYRWVAAGRELAVYEDLLELAEARVEGLEEEVRRGARAAIFLVENAQNLVRRQELVASARRDLRLRANALSIFLRGPDGQPIVPDRERLPAVLPPPEPLPVLPVGAIDQRPELAVLDAALDRVGLDLALAENELRPRLDFRVEAADDFGDIAEGGITRDEGELIAGLTFEVPLGRRVARGQIGRARAELEALRQERRLARDRIAVELRDFLLTLEAAEELYELAQQEVQQAEIVRAAEQRRFEGGASDFFLVNLREEALADARVRLARARFALAQARTSFDAAILDTERLGLD